MDKMTKGLMVFVAVIVAGILVFGVLTMRDQRSVGQKIDDAVQALPEGPDKAERQLEDRTPGQKLGDAVKDTGDKIKDNTNP